MVVEGVGMKNEDPGAAGGSEDTGSEGSYEGTKVSKSSGAESPSSAAAACLAASEEGTFVFVELDLLAFSFELLSHGMLYHLNTIRFYFS
jgi:hypothetical protein